MAANDVPCCESMFWVYLIISVALVTFAGLMSGLTLGLMSLSLVDLEVLVKAGQPQERKNAEKILPIVENQHLLLCTLLICNALAMEALPIFLDALLPAWGAILISVTLILAFGEIIPQAVCSRYGLSVGAKLSVVVRILVIVFFPLSYPISKLLDLVLGKKHSVLLRRAELKTFVDMHGNEAGKGGELTHDETTIITGALNLAQRTAKDAMTPMSKIFSVDLSSKLNEDTMSLIMRKGHSRIPIYSGSPTNIIGLILVKSLIKFRPDHETPIRNLTIRRIPRVEDCVPLYDILNQFQKGHSHMAVVVKSKHYMKAFSNNGTEKGDLLTVNIHSDSSLQNRGEGKGSENKLHNTSSYSTSVASSDTGIQSPASQLDNRGDETIPKEMLDALSYQEDEAIGIITMEDVLEELLQEEILDETDEYVDVHDIIKTSMLLPMQASSRSPGTPSHIPWRSPLASPFSSSHQTPSSKIHTPIFHSPISPYVRSPFIRPALHTSPAKSVSNSPSALASSTGSSPSSHRISRKEYGKLRKVNDP